ncbi:putative dehydrogenase [Actinacidiphila reveromycinica]|uniref:Putative dehydrogenase n=1 Tax=Actinacidiphila reveromycinica TaxID=659352 RepID=A0A7U3UMJ5_9ACTN|nr:zinc-dependent alcohol dehydrogenase family protein [Streptomyces sp. SN-593]BBA95279.1 putative dehydrogenase [Streptomyces sp. SN-593]
MRGAVLHAPGDVRLDQREDPAVVAPTDAVIRTVAACVCGSDLWGYRGVDPVTRPTPMGHEYVGVVEEVGADVELVRPGQFVVGSFFASDNTCPNCLNGYQSNCLHRQPLGAIGCQAEYVRIPLADGTLVATPGTPDDAFIPSLLACSDVMGTGWYAALAAEVGPGKTVAVVGDGAVGLCAVIAARELGAERIVAMSRHASRQRLATEFGATDVVTERGDEGIARIREMTGGIGADAVLECVGTEQAMAQALRSARPGGNVGFVGVPHGVAVDGRELFNSHVALRGGPAPVRAYLPDLVERVLDGRIDPGRVFDLDLPLEQVAEGYRAMDERRAIKALLRP